MSFNATATAEDNDSRSARDLKMRRLVLEAIDTTPGSVVELASRIAGAKWPDVSWALAELQARELVRFDRQARVWRRA